jgi:hypothetical protein
MADAGAAPAVGTDKERLNSAGEFCGAEIAAVWRVLIRTAPINHRELATMPSDYTDDVLRGAEEIAR